MTQDSAAYIAMLSMLSVFLPLIIGLFSLKHFDKFYKYVLASITISLVFDVFSFLSNVAKYLSASILGYYDFFAIICWGLAFVIIQKENNLKNSIPNILMASILMLSIYMAITNLSIFSINTSNATLSSLFILAGSTMLVMYFLVVKKEIEKSDILIIGILSANIVYHATTFSIFTFFQNMVSEQEMGMLYLVKWILYIVLNLIFAFTFYLIRKEKLKERKLLL